MTAQEYYRAGELQKAIDACAAEVRQNPGDDGRRGLLCELLCFAGDYERADRQLDALGHHAPQTMTGVSMIRHLLRAEQARQQFYTEGRLPEFLAPPSPWLHLHLEASIHLREGRPDEAARLLADAETQRPRLSGTCDGQPFDDFRDLDDLTACFFEVLTSNGKYYWIPTERVELVEFHPWQRPHDLLWRRAHMIVRDGPDGEVFLPALYAGACTESDDRFRLGRMTEWRGSDNEPVRGAGQRIFWIGGEERPILEIQTLTFGERPA